MRRSYISPEYISIPVYGTLNMREESTFFGAKMLEIEDNILIDNHDIIYYQMLNNEQIDLSVESSLTAYNYSTSDDKLLNHIIYKDKKQSTFQLENNTRWILEIKTTNILRNYLFNTMKKYRTFEGMRNETTLHNDVNIAIYNYIDNNVLNRYKLKNTNLFIQYNDLMNQSLLKFKTTWNQNIAITENIVKKTQIISNISGDSIQVLFNSDKPSSEYNFDYYFDLIFEKI